MRHIFIILFLLLIGAKSSAFQTNLVDNVYHIEDSVLIKTRDGAFISAIIVRKKDNDKPQPVILQFTIYARSRDIKSVKEAADKGYVGVMAYTRGKRFSPDEVTPYEYDGRDAYDVIDWISHQAWCNGKIGMYGGSYNGFSQWAATKQMHPALKTIVPYVANRPGMGLPMENNVFLNANYEWAFYVSNNKYLDTLVGNNRTRWRAMQNKWWESGVAYRKIDSLEGTPNKYLQRWLQHPAYDKYWQDMVPYKDEFAHINIPVLSIDGYYNDSQISGLYYVKEHYKYNKNANHYLIIGPYSHFGAQKGGEAVLQGYQVDSVALINTKQITYQWLDYILKDGKKPEILKDKINYEVMGANEWKHVPSLEKMSNNYLQLYLTNIKAGKDYQQLTQRKPSKQAYLSQEVDLADRTTSNNDYYPDPIIRKELDKSNGFFFLSDPFKKTISIAGAFSGEIKASINKKDMDIGVVLYEVMPNGEFFELSYFLGRASYAKDITSRNLLTPNKIEGIPFSNTRLVSRQLSKGSRLLVVLNIDKNSFAQINYGTGKDVSDETIADAKEPLKIKWYNDSFIKVPIWK
ncbi:CocE/NonD family hydrolase [Arcicella aquatica]|uniref:CocE/NonD family hydrolase n=1 Tax=Arcicella aquatica TaxID=217141 RepID=A0ABU5QKB7_9BACT|nr:CocE/NonD family hydrolase [Arcicella aquatica]MEA5257497.1 CocE/NonD family hydrolase [Arcicella aquatica]